jgi:hypothetical protein
VVFATVLPRAATDADVSRAERAIGRLADLKVKGAEVKVLRFDDAPTAILREAAGHGLMILGLQSVGRGKKVLGSFAERIADEAPCAAVFLSRRRPRAFEVLEPLRDDVVHGIRGVIETVPGRSRGEP